MEELIRNFINSLDKRPTTKETYRKSLLEYSKWLGDTSPIGLTHNDIQRYKDYITSKGLSTSSISAYLTSVRRLYDYLEGLGKIAANPAKNVKGGSRPQRHSTKSITRQDVKKLFESIDSSSPLGIRDCAILNLMVRCGLSEIEVVRANVGDIKTKDLRIVLDGNEPSGGICEIRAYHESESKIDIIKRANLLSNMPDKEIPLPWESGYVKDQGKGSN